MSSRANRIAILIDEPNLHATSKALGFDVGFRRLLTDFESRGTLLRAFYYTAIIEHQEYSSVRPLIHWLDYNGYTVVSKPTAAYVDEMILFSGDGDFRSLVEAIQRRGVRVTVVSSMACQPAMAADKLRRRADDFIDIKLLQQRIGRTAVERTQSASADSRRTSDDLGPSGPGGA